MLAGWGGGGGGAGGEPQASKTSLSGIAMKGPISGARVSAYQVATDGGKGLQIGNSVTTASDGTYKLDIPLQNGPVIIEIVGQAGASYVSEITGKPVPFGTTEAFRAITANASINQNITVGPFTEAGYQKTIQLLRASPTSDINTLIGQGNKFVADIHLISNILANPAADPNYIAALTILDKIIQTNPTYNTTTVTDMLTAAVTAVTMEGRAPYTNAVAAAGQQLLTIPGVSAILAGVQTFQSSPLPGVPSTPPVIPPVTPPVTPSATPPTAPTNVTASSTANSVTISWSASNSASGGSLSYYIYRNGTFIANVSSLTYTDSGLLPSTSYSYYLKAVDALGNLSGASTVVVISTQVFAGTPPPTPVDTTPPSTPANLRATALTSNSVSLAWDASTGTVAITGYEVQRDGGKIATSVLNSYTDTTLVIGKSYTFRVKAVNANGISSAFSNTITVTAESNPPLITPITITTGGNVQ